MIHKYRYRDLNIVLDVNSGAVHVVDDLVYELLDVIPASAGKAYEALHGRYKIDEIESALSDISELTGEGTLNTGDTLKSFLTTFEKKPVIKALCLHVAHDCNIRCEYCFASTGDFQGSRELMDINVAKKAFDFLVENSGNRRNLEVDFFGGEPLMNFGLVKEMVEYGRGLEEKYNKHFRFTLTTNGVLLNDEINEYLNEHMDNVVLSIDGTKAVNDSIRKTITGGGTYDIIVPKFKSLVESRKGKSYYVRGTFTKFNRDFAKDVIHLADLGFGSTSVEPVVSSEGLAYTLTDEDLPVIYKEYEKLVDEMESRLGTDNEFDFFHFNVDLTQGPCAVKRTTGCGAGSEYIAVTPSGDIYPCHQFVGDEDFKMGSVLDKSYDDDMAKDFGKLDVYSKKACEDCWAKFYCSGGCHANAYNFNGDMNIPYELGCKMERKRLEMAIYLSAVKMLRD